MMCKTVGKDVYGQRGIVSKYHLHDDVFRNFERNVFTGVFFLGYAAAAIYIRRRLKSI